MEPTFLEAVARVRKELAGISFFIAALGGGGSWLGLGEVREAETVSAELVKFYAPELGRTRMEVDRLRKKNEAQKDLCVGLLEAERENTAQWRDQCK